MLSRAWLQEELKTKFWKRFKKYIQNKDIFINKDTENKDTEYNSRVIAIVNTYPA